MKKKGLDRDIVVLLISTLITVASWVGFEVYRAYVKTTATPEVEEHLRELDPTLNKGVLNQIKERMQNEE